MDKKKVSTMEQSRRLAIKLKVNRSDVHEVICALYDLLHDALMDGEPIELKRIGRIDPTESAFRFGKDPRTLETISIPARRTIRLRPSRRHILKDMREE